MSGAEIIEGMKEAVAIAPYVARIAELEAALRTVDEDVRHHLRSDEIHAALIRPHAIEAVRNALVGD